MLALVASVVLAARPHRLGAQRQAAVRITLAVEAPHGQVARLVERHRQLALAHASVGMGNTGRVRMVAQVVIVQLPHKHC